MATVYENALSLSSLFDELLGASVAEVPNEYTKSVYMTMSHESYVDMLADNFEYTDKVRFAIESIIKSKTVDKTTWSVGNAEIYITDFSDNVRNILVENLQLSDGTEIEVIPVKYNDKRVWLNSPFRKPNGKICYRTIHQGTLTLHTEADVAKYEKYDAIYIEKLKPILLADLPDELKIQGENTMQVPEYSRKVLEDITKNAVTLYLQTRVPKQQVQQNPQQQSSGKG
jgi:hypothetical protein